MKCFIYLLWIITVLCLLSGCSNEESKIEENGTGKDAFNIGSYKNIFENTASGLLPVDFGTDRRDGVKKAKKQLLNIIPGWEEYRAVTLGDVNFLEIPLSGDVYNAGTWTIQQKTAGSADGFNMETKLLWNKSFLIIREDTKNDSLTYYIVDMAMEDKDLSGLYFLGNDKIGDGFVIVSDLEGRCTASYRVEGGKRYAITITPGIQSEDGREFNSISLNHIPNLSRRLTKSYSSDENGDGGFGTSGNGWAFCSVCGAKVWGNGNCGCPGVIIDGQGPNPDDWWMPGGGGAGGSGGDSGGGTSGSGGGSGGNGYPGGGGSGYPDNPNPDPEIQIGLPIPTIDIGEYFHLTTTSKNLNDSQIVYKIAPLESAENSYYYDELGHQASNLCKMPGEYVIQAVVVCNGTTVLSNKVTLKVVFPNISSILSMGEIQSAINEAWTKTETDAGATQCREHGFIAYINTKSGSRVIEIDKKESPFVPYNNGIQINLDYDTDQPQRGDFIYGGRYVIFLFHTHPPYFNATPASTLYRRFARVTPPVGTDPGDVSPDIPAATKDYPGVWDSNVGVYTHSNKDTKTSPQIWPYGSDRRTRFPI